MLGAHYSVPQILDVLLRLLGVISLVRIVLDWVLVNVRRGKAEMLGGYQTLRRLKRELTTWSVR